LPLGPLPAVLAACRDKGLRVQKKHGTGFPHKRCQIAYHGHVESESCNSQTEPKERMVVCQVKNATRAKRSGIGHWQR
jgi:hypothetical protein